MVIGELCKMTVKGVKLKSESFFSISYGVLELWRKNPKGGEGGFRASGPDKVKEYLVCNLRSNCCQMTMLLTFEIFMRARNHG